LADSGFVDGQNVTIELRWAEGDYDRLPGLAAELAVLIGVGGDVLLLPPRKQRHFINDNGIEVFLGLGREALD
jgi:hypothetical protein